MNMTEHILSLVISSIAARYFIVRIYRLLAANSIYTSNYSGRPVVTGMGLALMFPCLLGTMPFLIHRIEFDYLGFVTAVVSLVVLGVIDDILGDGKIRGIKGHLMVILKGGLSTGGIKLIIALFLSILLSFYYHSYFVYRLVYTLIFLLFINFINLMDLRPGRATKVFLISVIILLLTGRFNNLWIFTPVATAIPFYIKGEMREQYMLGDTGANLLGGILGYYTIKNISPAPAFIMAFILLAIHIVAEYYSISKIIESVPILRQIDQLWRMKDDADTGMDRV